MKIPNSAKALLFLLVPAMLFSFSSLAADKANFSGEWKLNEAKSEMGEFGGRLAARSIKVDEKADLITITKTSPAFNGGENTTTESLSFDGKETETTVFNGAKKKSNAKWSDDGQTLTINYSIQFERNGQTTEIKGTETWLLTKEGNLSLTTFSVSPRGENTTKAVYDK